MPTSSIVTLPTPSDAFAVIGVWAQGVFAPFLIPALYGIGIIIGAYAVVFLVGLLVSAAKTLFMHLTGRAKHDGNFWDHAASSAAYGATYLDLDD